MPSLVIISKQLSFKIKNRLSQTRNERRKTTGRADESEELCKRCREMDFVGMIRHGSEHQRGRSYAARDQRTVVERLSVAWSSRNCASCRLLRHLSHEGVAGAALNMHLAYSVQRLEGTINDRIYSESVPPGQNSKRATLFCACWPELSLRTKFWYQDQEWLAKVQPAITPDAFGILDEESTPGAGVLMAVRRKSSLLNMDLLRQWLQICDEHHVQTCRPIFNSVLRSVKLIDVILGQIVPFPHFTDCKYFCLSYVWGDMKQRESKLGALPTDLPLTITDAIAFVREFGERYLWVDTVRF